jgi:hypothetical protein
MGTAQMRPIDPTSMATICVATVSLLTASRNGVSPMLKMRRTGSEAPA